MALRSVLKNDKRNGDATFVQLITAVCGGFLRHYYSLEKAVKSSFPDAADKERQVLSIAVSDKLFSKRLSQEKMFGYLKQECPEHVDQFKAFVDSINEPFQLIGTDVQVGSDEFIHLRYNLPLFLVRMWRKNCKYVLSNKLFKTLKKNDAVVLRINSSKISVEDFKKKYPDVEILENKYAVIKGKNKRHPSIANLDALDMRAGYSFALQDVDLDFSRGVAVYGGASNNVIDELFALFGSLLKMDYLCGNQKHFFEVTNKVKRYGVSDVSLYECGEDALRTCISQPVHTFIVSPNNTSYQRLVNESDYFLRISQEQLDEMIKGERLALENASALVEEGGQLVYIIPTLCRNETYALVKDFLNKHKEFSLEKEYQLFPFDKYNSLLYFAVLKKEIKHD